MVTAVHETVLANLTNVRAALETRRPAMSPPVSLGRDPSRPSTTPAIVDVLTALDNAVREIDAIFNRGRKRSGAWPTLDAPHGLTTRSVAQAAPAGEPRDLSWPSHREDDLVS
jgi:hypothetical protein